MDKKKIVIIGAGSGGTILANRLARSLHNEIKMGQAEITLIGNSDKHIYQPGYMFIAFNDKPSEHFIRKQQQIMHKNVRFLIDDIKEIDVDKKQLSSTLATYVYDILIIATGSHPDFNSVPGLKEGSHNFYTLEGAERMRKDLAAMTEGKILITVDVPHKCPAAPLEMALMLEDYFRKKGIRDKIEVKYTYPINRIHSLQPVADWAMPAFEERGILYETFFNLDKVDAQKKLAITMDGSEHSYDMLLSIPAHTGAEVIINSGLGDESGFIPTDRHTLKMEGQHDVYVIGDATNLPISKAGSAAHYEAEIVSANIESRIKGLPETALYNGKVACFLENGLDDASMITFDYNHPPQPAETSEFLHWFKGLYNELYWLNARGIV